MIGKIKNLASDRGFGFIAAEDGREFFFHRSAMLEPGEFYGLRTDDSVAFEPGEGPKGLRAERVSLGATIESASP
jgi:CspA family cold shock protein